MSEDSQGDAGVVHTALEELRNIHARYAAFEGDLDDKASAVPLSAKMLRVQCILTLINLLLSLLKVG